MTLYKNKYRIESARLKSWDYSSDGAYYITICVKNRECIFGNITKGKMIEPFDQWNKNIYKISDNNRLTPVTVCYYNKK